MKQIFIPLFVYCFTLLGLQSCDRMTADNDPESGEVSTRNFNFNNFDALEIGSAFHVNVKAGTTYSLLATGEGDDLDDLDIYKERGKLIIRYKKIWGNRRGKMILDITMPALVKADFSGAVRADVRGFENVSAIALELSGTAQCLFKGSAKDMEVHLAGSSSLTVAGKGHMIHGSLLSASELSSLGYQVEEADLKLSGTSKGSVLVSRLLKAEAGEASSLTYQGNPDVQEKVSGRSSVNKNG